MIVGRGGGCGNPTRGTALVRTRIRDRRRARRRRLVPRLSRGGCTSGRANTDDYEPQFQSVLHERNMEPKCGCFTPFRRDV